MHSLQHYTHHIFKSCKWLVIGNDPLSIQKYNLELPLRVPIQPQLKIDTDGKEFTTMIKTMKGNDSRDNPDRKKNAKLGKRWNRLRSHISPEARRKMEALLAGNTVVSAPADLDGCIAGPNSIQSAPPADFKFFKESMKQKKKVGRRHSKEEYYDEDDLQAKDILRERRQAIPPIENLSSVQRFRRENVSNQRKYGTSIDDNDNDCISLREPPPVRSLKNVRRFNSEKNIISFDESVDEFQELKQRRGMVNSPSFRKYKKSVGEITSQSMDSQQLLFRRKSEHVKSNVKIPQGIITIVITDVEGSTKLWEKNPIVMKEALDLHDSVIRRCYTNHNGYEITTEGDCFILAFHHPLDALSFALQAQVDLYNAKWSDRLLSLADTKLDEPNVMRGLRVRIGLDHGETVSNEHEVTKRTFYKGEAMSVAKAIEKITHGGQIVTTVETWRAVSGMAERYLGSPQVVDCGEYDLHDCYEDGSFIRKKLVQLVPKRFAYNYFAWRGEKDTVIDDGQEGRLFPPLKSDKQTNTGFQDAPFKGNKVVLVFVYTVRTTDDLCDEAKANNSSLLSKYIRYQLLACTPPGYECQETDGQWMLAFHTLESAINFGVKIVQKLECAPLNVKVGIQQGLFTSQGPHAVTGRADYFGPVVNRAARIAAIGEAGQVLLGVPEDSSKNFKIPSLEEVHINFLRCANLKGVSVSTTLYECSAAK